MKRTLHPRSLRALLRREEGIGLVEVLVAIVLLGILATAFLPVLITSMRLAASNVTATKAAQLLTDEFEQAQTQQQTCTALALFASRATMPVPDSRGVQLQVERQLVGPCPSSFPASIELRAEVKRLDTDVSVSEANTRLFLVGP